MLSLKNKQNLILLIVAIIGVVLFVALYKYVFPEFSVDVKIDSDDSQRISDNIIRNNGYNPDEYESSTIFLTRNEDLLFLQDTVGLERATQIMKEKIPLVYWSTVYYKELEIERFLVSLTADGKLLGYYHIINDTAPGNSLNQSDTLRIAEEFVRSQGINLSNYELSESRTTTKENRVDHTFRWREKGFIVPYGSSNATVEVGVTIAGDKVSGFYRDHLSIPEEYRHDFAKENSNRMIFGLVSILFTILIYIGVIFSFVKNYRRISKKFAFYSALLIVALSIVQIINAYPTLSYGYDGTSTFVVYYSIIALFSLIAATFGGIAIFLVAGAGSALMKHVFKHAVDGIKRFFSRRFSQDAFIGYCLAGILLGYLALFYSLGKYLFGFWAPAGISNIASFNVLVPFLVPLTISLVAAISEEFIYRMFAVSFIKKYLKFTWLALLIPALIWAFGHSAYIVSPIYARFIELTIAGIILGLFFIRYGVWTVVIAHYVLDAVLLSIPLLASSNTYLFLSGIGVIGLALVPGIIGFFVGRYRNALR